MLKIVGLGIIGAGIIGKAYLLAIQWHAESSGRTWNAMSL